MSGDYFMDYDTITLAIELSEKIKDDSRYKRIRDLSDIIDIKYKDEYKAYSTALENYTEASKYGKYHPSLEKYNKDLSQAKKIYFSKPEVVEYQRLYKEFQEELDDMMNKLKESVSNKMPLTKPFNIGGCHGCKK